MSTAATRRAAEASEVASPCTSVCEMDAGSGLCRGCFRTLDEIAAWSVLDAEAKKAVLSALLRRRAAYQGTDGR